MVRLWFCTTGLPSDIIIEVEDMTFHLHKFPLMSKSRKLHQLITEQEANTQATEEGDEEEEEHEIEEVHCQISLPEFPGGSETFEMAAKFCYGVKIDLTSATVAPLRCAGEFLEMTEEYSEDNLISKTERFLSQSVLKSLKESVKALKSCEKVMPLSETLNITQRCIDSITCTASTTDPALFGWPVTDNPTIENKATSNQALWNGIESAVRRKGAVAAGRGSINADSWLEHLSLLSLPLFKRLILAMKARDLSPEIIETCLMYYAKKYIPGITRLNRKQSSSSSSSIASEIEQRELLETIISFLPLQKSSTRSTTSTTTRFLFGLLRTANILNASESCRSTLEKKIGSELEQATLDDLLIPSYSYLNETLYDVDCLERILGYFLDGIQEDDNQSPSLMLVGKLIDGYLAEIASDANLKPDRFYNLAISLPEQARLFDDGLYRAVDVYLKAHPWISETEREKISGVIDCQKLTLEACTHAAQNERLPLRAVVQVLFFEQLQLRHAIAGTLMAAEDPARPSVLRREQEEVEVEVEVDEGGAVTVAGHENNSSTWRAAVRENQVLRLDMDSMRTRVHQLERECSTMKKVIEKIDKEGPRGWRGSITRKLGCKFKTQVCDSHESTVVNVRKGRQQHHPHHHQQ
ncbi:BTB/POZ domain-containing protein At5g66560 isoform X2 [Ricinus communis]|uniref:BTB/POZ domain-containing protein At5g66560 isoform X2 n=1 Tax=Ricinus communis TaxID=3988 RepID=UPI0007722501|nr:BTB/POZ domain-containing protein At5g66560 isoform X2 [Ricinus communis]|eukprot:XP_015576766.1 BTB/POZ domain-containing protein At5g66560 isoform X2 [Ricinus communis]